MRSCVLACLIGIASIASTALPPAEASSAGFQPIAIEARMIDAFLPSAPEQRFGSLEFRGGLELTSSDRRFGSLSGLDFSSDGQTLYAVSDTGRWFAAQPIEKGGRLVGLSNARIAPILNHGGVPLAGKKWGDAEALRIVGVNGRDSALVAFEQTNDLRAFTADDFVLSGSRPVELPAAITSLSGNRGLESVAVAPASGPLAGAMVLIAENALDRKGNHRGWIVGGPRAGAFAIERVGNYDVTDAVFLPDGDLLVLERALQLPFGLGMRISRIAGSSLLPGATAASETLMEADLRHQIDNMEGLAVRTNKNGETIVAIVSDNNNNSVLQRTLLLYFALAE
jgi:hypothetical protein